MRVPHRDRPDQQSPPLAPAAQPAQQRVPTPSGQGTQGRRPSPGMSRRRAVGLGLAAPVALAAPALLARLPADHTTATADAATARSGPGRPSGDPWPARFQAALDQMVRGDAASGTEASVAALGWVDGPHERWQGGAGAADLAARHPGPPGPDHRFRIGSVSKVFAATVVLQLVGEGLLRLDDPVGRHVPGQVPGQDRLTVRHLLAMTSGLPDFQPLLFPSIGQGRPSYQEFHDVTSRPVAPRDLVSRAAAGGLAFEPGSAFEYSTTNYLVLGLIVEQVTGRPYGDELRRRIVRPLRLHRTGLPSGSGLGLPSTPPVPRRPEGVAPAGPTPPAGPEPGLPYLHGYGAFADRAEHWVDVSVRHEHGWAGGALVSTATDLATFFTALLGGRLLAPELLAAMKVTSGAPAHRPGAPPGAPSGRTYGLGLLRQDDAACGELWGHGGTTHGYDSSVRVTGDGRTCIVVARTGFPGRLGPGPSPLAPFVTVAAQANCPP